MTDLMTDHFVNDFEFDLEFDEKNEEKIDKNQLDFFEEKDEGVTIPLSRRYTMDAAYSLPNHSYINNVPRHSVDWCHRSSFLRPASLPKNHQRTNSTFMLSVPSTTSHWYSRSRGSSPSPKTKLIPKVLRSSFSKLFSGKAKSPTPPRETVSASTSQTNIVYPLAEDIVKESIEKGLPIIPFAFQTLSRPESQLTSENIKETNDTVIKSDESDYFSMNPGEMDEGTTVASNPSSYVEMSPVEDLSLSSLNEGAYMPMTKKCLSSFVDKTSSLGGDPFIRGETVKKNHVRGRRHSIKAELASATHGRQYTKGHKHKDDYVFVDLGHNQECMEQSKAVHEFMSI